MRILVICVSALLIMTCTSTQPAFHPETVTSGDYSQIGKALDERIEKQMKSARVTGMSIGIVDGSDLVWSKGYGFADRERGIAADDQTVYRIGSVSKLLTATAIMDLVESGRIDLDAPVTTYVPELSIRYHGVPGDTIRVRHLLTHHSGLHGDYLYEFAFYKPLEKDVSKAYLEMPGILNSEFAQYPPDHVFSYCNNAFTLLGVIIQRVTGIDYSEYMDQTLFEPLGMTHSSMLLNDRVADQVATGYQMHRPKEMPYIRDLPAGSGLSSVEDMARFMSMYLADGVTVGGDTLLDSATIAAMFEQQNGHVALDRHLEIGYAFWRVNPYDMDFEQSPVGHGGDLPPFHALLMMIPEADLGAVVMTNSNTGTAVIMPAAMEALALAYEIKTGKRIDYANLELVDNFNPLDYKSFEGSYALPIGFATVSADAKHLKLKTGPLTFLLQPRQDGSFGGAAKAFGLIPINSPQLDLLSFHLFEHGGTPIIDMAIAGVNIGIASAIEAPDIPAAWQSRVGKYERINLEQPFTKTQIPFTLLKPRLQINKDGFLLLTGNLFGSPVALPLEPLDETTAVVQGVGRMSGQTVRIEERDGMEVLSWSGMEFVAN